MNAHTPFICKTCGHQHAPSMDPPARCAICEDERQYVGWFGQQWTTLEELASEGHRTVSREVEPGLWGIGVTPRFAIGQRGLVVTTPHGNLLWDVPGFIDDDAELAVDNLGGLAAISASHPHFYGVMVEWAEAFDAPIFLPEVDRDWIMRPDRRLELYEDSAVPVPGTRIVTCGGHFPGSAVLEWPAGADGRGALLTGDTVTVTEDRDWVSIMWSYPNLIPLDEETLRSIGAVLDGLHFDRVYGGWWDSVVRENARAKVAASIERYVERIGGTVS
jgi:glyoxylase-like metal-dependent hydrolase (beta-lactamase superfamily II)